MSAGGRLLRTALALLVVLVLLAGLVAGLVALATAVDPARAEPPPAALCRAEVDDPDGGVAASPSSPRTAPPTPRSWSGSPTSGACRPGRRPSASPPRSRSRACATSTTATGTPSGCSSSARRRAGAPRSRSRTRCTRRGRSTTPWSGVDGYTELEITDAAQRVQRSGFPEAYADHEDEGRALASSLYGLSPASLWCELPAVDRAGGGRRRPDPAAPDAGGGRGGDRAADLGPGGWTASAVEASEPPGGEDAPAGAARCRRAARRPPRRRARRRPRGRWPTPRSRWPGGTASSGSRWRAGLGRARPRAAGWLDGATDAVEGGSGPRPAARCPGTGWCASPPAEGSRSRSRRLPGDTRRAATAGPSGWTVRRPAAQAGPSPPEGTGGAQRAPRPRPRPGRTSGDTRDA